MGRSWQLAKCSAPTSRSRSNISSSEGMPRTREVGVVEVITRKCATSPATPASATNMSASGGAERRPSAPRGVHERGAVEVVAQRGPPRAGRCSTGRRPGPTDRRWRRSVAADASAPAGGVHGEGDQLRPGGELAGQRDESAPDRVLGQSYSGSLVRLVPSGRPAAVLRAGSATCRSSRSASWRHGCRGSWCERRVAVPVLGPADD